MKPLTGTGVALVTPFDKALNVDFQSLEKLLAHITDSSVRYWVVHGTTGEAATTTPEEKKEILTFIQAHNPKQLPIVLGMGGNSTQEVLKAIDNTNFEGIHAAMIASPHYNKPSQEGIEEHYKTIAAACPVPVIVYNIPARTGTNIQAETTLQLSKHSNIVGIKEASGNLLQCIEIAQGGSSKFLLISGEDMLTIPMLSIGAVGVISTIANIFPKAMSYMTEFGIEGNYPATKRYVWELLPATQLISQLGNPVGTKQLLAHLGICQPHVRLPLVAPSLSPSLEEAIAKAIQRREEE